MRSGAQGLGSRGWDPLPGGGGPPSRSAAILYATAVEGPGRRGGSRTTPPPLEAPVLRPTRRFRSVLLAAAAGSASLLAGCGGERDAGGAERQPPDAPVAADEAFAGPRHVFLVTIDTLRADRLGLYGAPRETSPTIDRLGAEGVVFERAIAQWPKTGPSFASIFTGQYPQTTGITHDAAVRVPEGYLTLSELMGEAGFTTVAVVSNGVLSAELGWDRGFDEYVETWHTPEGASEDPVLYRKSLNALRVNELALPLLERHQDAERLFVWLHYSDPHAPYVLPEGYENPFVGDPYYVGDEEVVLEKPRATALGERRDLEHYVASYDANVLVADEQIGVALERAAELGLLDDALVVVTADHGESLGEHGYYFGHGRLPHNVGSHVPLLFRSEGLAPARLGEPVELVDLYPTLRDLVAPELEVAGLEGESLLAELRGEAADDPAAVAFSQAGGGSPLTHYRSVQDRRWKLVYHPALDGKRPEPRQLDLYDLEADPGETVDLESSEPEELRRLQRLLHGWMRGDEWIKQPREYVEEQSEATKRALRALGYL